MFLHDGMVCAYGKSGVDGAWWCAELPMCEHFLAGSGTLSSVCFLLRFRLFCVWSLMGLQAGRGRRGVPQSYFFGCEFLKYVRAVVGSLEQL